MSDAALIALIIALGAVAGVTAWKVLEIGRSAAEFDHRRGVRDLGDGRDRA